MGKKKPLLKDSSDKSRNKTPQSLKRSTKTDRLKQVTSSKKEAFKAVLRPTPSPIKKDTNLKNKPATNQPIPLDNPAAFKDQLRDLISTQIVPYGMIKGLLFDLKDLPAIVLRDDLTDYICEKQPLYARFLSLVMMGGSIPNCALICGINRNQIVEWRNQGVRDLSEGKDTYHARFVNDLNVSALIPTLDAEQTIHRKDPLEWLRSGPGKWVNPEGTWQPAQTKIAITPAEPTVGIAEPQPNRVEDEQKLLDAPTVQDLPNALSVLREVGLGHIIDGADHANNQASNGDISNPGDTVSQDQ